MLRRTEVPVYGRQKFDVLDRPPAQYPAPWCLWLGSNPSVHPALQFYYRGAFCTWKPSYSHPRTTPRRPYAGSGDQPRSPPWLGLLFRTRRRADAQRETSHALVAIARHNHGSSNYRASRRSSDAHRFRASYTCSIAAPESRGNRALCRGGAAR